MFSFSRFSLNDKNVFRFSSADVVYALLSQLELPAAKSEDGGGDTFLQSLDLLSRSNVPAMEQALVTAREDLVTVIQQVQTFFATHSVVSAGPFLYAVLPVRVARFSK